MSITDADTKTSTASAATQAPVDINSIVSAATEAAVGRMIAYQGQQNQQQAPAVEDEVTQLIKAAKAQNMDDPTTVLLAQTADGATRKAMRLAQEQLGREGMNLRVQMREAAANNAINRILRQTYRDNPELKEFEASIKQTANKLFFEVPQNTHEYNNMLYANEAAIEDAVEKAVEKVGSKLQPATNSKGLPIKFAGRSKNIPDNTDEDLDDLSEPKPDFDADDLEPHQRAAFFAMKGTNVNRLLQMGRFKSEKEAIKDAWDIASRLDKTPRLGTRIANYA